MNRRVLQYEAALPLKTRYTVWMRMPNHFAHISNCCTLAVAIQMAQRMRPKGYITNYGEKP